MTFARRIGFGSGLNPISAMLGLLGMVALFGCGSSTPDMSELDQTPANYYEGGKQLNTAQLVEMVSRNPMFDITDERGLAPQRRRATWETRRPRRWRCPRGRARSTPCAASFHISWCGTDRRGSACPS